MLTAVSQKEKWKKQKKNNADARQPTLDACHDAAFLKF